MALISMKADRPSKGYSLDRINNNSGYEPSNCRWASKSEQAKNRRRPASREHIIRVDGLSLTELSLLHGINRGTIKRRYKEGKRGADLIAPDLRDGSYWRGRKRTKRETRKPRSGCGFALHKKTGKWQAQISVNGRNRYLGLFYEKEDAISAYKAAASETYDHHLDGTVERR